MRVGRLLTSTLSILAQLLAGGSMAFAQDTRSWVDPPAQSGAIPQTPSVQPHPAPAAPSPQSSQAPKLPPVSPTPEAHQTAQPPQPARPPVQPPPPEPRTKAAEPQPKPESDRRVTRADAARDFAIEYLASWSARNDVALDATAELYAPRVLFHGRTVSLERLYKEKQRFISRWPEREYHPRQDAIGTVCNPAGTVCTVHAVFDYTAANPKRHRLSQGSGALQLIVEFIGDKPVIVAEHSTLLTQTRKRILTSEGTSNE
jgi:hypothetical protein